MLHSIREWWTSLGGQGQALIVAAAIGGVAAIIAGAGTEWYGLAGGDEDGAPTLKPASTAARTPVHTPTETATAVLLTAAPTEIIGPTLPPATDEMGRLAGEWLLTGSRISFKFALREKVNGSETYDYTEIRGDFIGVTLVGGGRAVLEGAGLRMNGVDQLGAYEMELDLLDEYSMSGRKVHETEGESVVTMFRLRD